MSINNEQKNTNLGKKSNKTKKDNILSIIGGVLLLLAHVLFGVVILMSYRYYAIEMNVILSIIAAIIVFFIIVDVVFFIGHKFRDQLLKIITIIILSLTIVASSGAIYVLSRVNTAVENVTENTGVEQFEDISVSFVTYQNEEITSYADLEGKTVGVVFSDGMSATSIGQEFLEKEGINVTISEYTTIDNVFVALIDGDVDAVILQSGYKALLGQNEANVALLDATTEVHKFTETVKTGENESANKDLSTEPFNVLLIGYAPDEGGGGLADTIIVATINPQTLTASLTSIPRDSYVPVTCWGGNSTKINHARGTSRQCLMDTVGELLDIDLDFYMEVNFDGVVDIVDALGGIIIDSPVEFVGQTSSVERGEYTVWIPEGEYLANGEEALAFSRERYAMPNGDFDRQVHQQEVIVAVLEKLLSTRDVNVALEVLDAAGENLSTNLSITQLTSLFNLIINTENHSNLPFFSLIDLRNVRLTGYFSSYYDYGSELILSIIKLYEGSIQDAKDNIDDVMGVYDDIEQTTVFKYFEVYPYNRPLFYSETYNEAYNHPTIPPIVENLYGMTASQVEAWAAENGASVNIVYVQDGDPNYNPNAIGTVSGMSEREGRLLANIGTLTVWISGELSTDDKVPNFVGGTLSNAESWGSSNGKTIVVNYIKSTDSRYDATKAGTVASQNVAAGTNKNSISSITIEVYEASSNLVALTQTQLNSLAALVGKTKADAASWASTNGIANVQYVEQESAEVAAGNIINYMFANNDGGAGAYTNSTYVFYISKGATVVTPSPETPAPETPVPGTPTPLLCPDGQRPNADGTACEAIPHEHTWVEQSRVEPTYAAPGKIVYVCSSGDGASYEETIPQLTCNGTVSADGLTCTPPAPDPGPTTPDPGTEGGTTG